MTRRIVVTNPDDPPSDGEYLQYDAASDTWSTADLSIADYPYHDESLTDGAGNFIFAGGDIITIVGVSE